MQGHQKLFTSLFEPQERKHCKSDSTIRRDEALVYRYYYHLEIQRTRYDDVLRELDNEFYITPRVIIEALSLNYVLLKRLVEEKPKLPRLKKMYPHFVWLPKQR